MELSAAGIKNRAFWEASDFILPAYDVEEAKENTVRSPRWAHFGVGNIFRVFIGGISDELLNRGLLDTAVTCVETYDHEVIDRIYRPFDDLALSVILFGDGSREKRVLGSLGESIKAGNTDKLQQKRLTEVFQAPSLQLVSFTITEKGYATMNAKGEFLPAYREDVTNGPQKTSTAIGVLTAMLLERFRVGGYPLALVSMDNCAHNGDLLKSAVLQTAGLWQTSGFVDKSFIDYLSDRDRVSFPITMIDKITPRPSVEIASELAADGVENMAPVITEKKTYIAPFVNAEKPQYLVIEDCFPNGRPPLQQINSVYLTDRETVEKAERMKVTACLNPVHSATGPFGVLLGIDLFADVISDPDLSRMAKAVAYDEGLPVAPDPGIISPRAFTDELFKDRFPNRYLGDTNLRLCTDVSQGVGVRFGETIKEYTRRYGSADRLTAIPLGIAGWLRYMLAVDDRGEGYELAPDPMNEAITALLADVRFDDPKTLSGQLRPLLSDSSLFHVDLYSAGVGEKIETMFSMMLSGKGGVRRTIHRFFG